MQGRWLTAAVFVAVAQPIGRTLPAQDSAAVVMGRIVSETGLPLEGANALIESLNLSVGTTAEGRFRIAIPPARVQGQSVVLRARALGYKWQDRTITLTAGTQTQDFILRTDINRLEAVVVVGAVTGTSQNKLAYSATQIDAVDMPVPGTNVLTQLQGKVPGALVVQPSGRPGRAPAIVLRGPKSLNATGRSHEPLFIVDGIILSGGLQEINPQDIERIEIVKGAAASSLYGSRAGAGAIQITTKSGRAIEGGTRVTARTEFGVSDVQGEYQFARRHFLQMDERGERFCIRVTGQPRCSRMVDFVEEARRINDTPQAGALQPYGFERDFGLATAPTRQFLKGLFQVDPWPVSYDPVAQVLTTGQYQNHTVDFAGRSGATSIFASASDLSEEGPVRFLRGYRRNSARLNAEHSSNEWWNSGLSVMASRSRQFPSTSDPLATDLSSENLLRVTRAPAGVDMLRRDQLGRLYIRPDPLAVGLGNLNPLYYHENFQGQRDDDRLLASLSTRYAPLPWLAFDATASADRGRGGEWFLEDRGFRTATSTLPAGSTGFIREESSSRLAHNLGLNAKADFTVGTDWRGTVTSRYTTEQLRVQQLTGSGTGLAVPGLRTVSNATANILTRAARGTIRSIGVINGAQVEYRGRYIVDGLVRYDGSSLFGEDERWHPYFRSSMAWRVSDERFWPFRDAVNDLKLRASVGTAGAHPNFSAQYETFAIAAGGQVTAVTLGNRRLKPERTLETEFGFDAEIRQRAGLSVTYARDITRDQLLLVPAPVSSGYPAQWANAGTLDGKTWEVSLRLPLVTARDLTWTTQLTWDRNRNTITALGVPPYYVNLRGDGAGASFYYAAGERFGTFHGRRFVTSCAELPSPFSAQCGPGQEWQVNNEGYVVWVGEGNSWRDGVTKNLWQAVRPGCLRNGAPFNATGEAECVRVGGTVNAPWGAPSTHWGMPTLLRDSTSAGRVVPLGNSLPDYRAAMAHSVQWKQISVHVLVDASVGNDVYNLERQWALGDFLHREQDQAGRTVETAKPIGYYWRQSEPGSTLGVGGFYDALGANNRVVEDGSYAKLRELSLTYDLPRLAMLRGRWNVSLIGRNLYTWTNYSGWDPEIGLLNGQVGSAALAAVGGFQYPPTRTFTVSLRGEF